MCSKFIHTSLLKKKNNIFHYFGSRSNALSPEEIQELELSQVNRTLELFDHYVPDKIGPDNLVYMEQIHGNKIKNVEKADFLKETDGLITKRKDLYLIVRTADCAPIFLYNEPSGTVAALHCGWRGTIKNILEKAVQKMEKEYNINPSEVVVSIGPSLRKCCFEIGTEIIGEFGSNYIEKRKDKYYLKFIDLIISKLVSQGINRKHIEVVGQCTRCNQDRFYSYRATKGQTGRMLNIIGMTDN